MILQCRSKEPLKAWEIPVLYPAGLEIDQARSVIVEVGPGRGDFLYYLAGMHPESLIAAIEIKRKRIDRLVHRLQKCGIDNVLLIQSDARCALPRFFEKESIDEIHINFPDPWPKKRHTKNRIMTEEFLRECAQRLKRDGHLYYATDQNWYAEEVRDIATHIDAFTSCFKNGIEVNPADAFPTLFMQKWKELGRTLYYQKYTKI